MFSADDSFAPVTVVKRFRERSAPAEELPLETTQAEEPFVCLFLTLSQFEPPLLPLRHPPVRLRPLSQVLGHAFINPNRSLLVLGLCSPASGPLFSLTLRAEWPPVQLQSLQP